MHLQDLLARVEPVAVYGDTQRNVSGVTQDSRSAGAQDVFVAIRGSRMDGHDFAGQVGCAAVVVEQDVQVQEGVTCIHVQDSRVALAEFAAALAGDPSERLALIGVTGTNGKTTTCWLLESILAGAGRAVGVVGTTGNRIRGEHRPARFTTPLPTEWHGLLQEMVDAGCDVVAAEVSSIGLEARRVDASRFAVGVFTSLGRDHLDFHGDMDAYISAKLRLFQELVMPEGVAVLPANDPTGERLSRACQHLRVRTFGLDDGDISAREVRFSPRGTHGILSTPDGDAPFAFSLVGRHNLQNALAAAGAALALDATVEDVVNGLSAVGVVPGRLEPVEGGEGPTVLVDYAHTPDALEAVLRSLREVSAARVGVVFGCGGDRDRGKRPEMARAACKGADWVLATTDNPRGEDPLDILEEVRLGLGPDAEIEPDRARAIQRAVTEWAQVDDVVLIAGKGHEQYQEIQGERLPFDDRQVAAAALSAREDS